MVPGPAPPAATGSSRVPGIRVGCEIGARAAAGTRENAAMSALPVRPVNAVMSNGAVPPASAVDVEQPMEKPRGRHAAR